MALRILALGDAHFMVSNIREVDIFLKKLKEYLDKHSDEIDIIVNLGDTLDTHERLHVTSLNKAIEYTRLLSSYKPTYILVGNHDAECNSIYLSSKHWLNCLKGMKNVKVVDTIFIETIKGKKVVLCPYVPDGRFIEALNTRKGEWEDSSCIFGHQTIKGAKMGSLIAKDADEWSVKYPMFISGHIHLSHWLGPNMYYTGSIMQVAVDESPEKHISLVILDKDIKIKEIDLCLPKKQIIRLEIEDIDNFKVPDNMETKYTLYISGNYEEFKTFRKSSKYRELVKISRLTKIRFEQKRINSKDKINSIEYIERCKQKRFKDFLHDSVCKENDEMLLSFYKSIIL